MQILSKTTKENQIVILNTEMLIIGRYSTNLGGLKIA